MLTQEERNLELEKGWDVGFITGYSDNEIRVDEEYMVELLTYRSRAGVELFVDTALGGGVGGYYVFSRSASGARKRFKRIGVSESVSLAQAKLNSYVAGKGFKAVGKKKHPNCISRRVIRGFRTLEADKELHKDLAKMPYDLFCECFPDGLWYHSEGRHVLEYTHNVQLNRYIDVLHRLIRDCAVISDEAFISLLKRPEKIREDKEWGKWAGKPVGLAELVGYLKHFCNIYYNSHKPDPEKDSKHRMGKSNWECLNKKQRAKGRYMHETYSRLKKLWSQCQGGKKTRTFTNTQLQLPFMDKAA